MSGSLSLPANRREAILVDRARRLARPRKTQEAVTFVSCLVCEAGGELFGIPVVSAARVTPAKQTAAIPTSNPALVGITSRGGMFHHLYDLARLVGLEPVGSDGHFVMLRGAPAIALRVERALRVADLVALAPSDTPQMQASRTCVTGYARPLLVSLFEGRTIALIDPDKLVPDAGPGRVEGD
jgi:chemotaxis signal transduction protein